jgi:hypothetical protein
MLAFPTSGAGLNISRGLVAVTLEAFDDYDWLRLLYEPG